MKRVLVGLLVMLAGGAGAQSLSSINYSYWYNPAAEIALNLRPVVEGRQVRVFYGLEVKAAGQLAEGYAIRWERRESLSDAQGQILTPPDSVMTSAGTIRQGRLTVELSDKPWLLVAVVTRNGGLNPWYFFRVIDVKYPVDMYFSQAEGVLMDNFAMVGKTYRVHAQASRLHGFYYKSYFPAAYPAFSDAPPVVDKFMIYDSTFVLGDNEFFTPKKPGLYLFQHDTLAAKGYSLFVPANSYPRLGRVEQLSKPLIYVTTPEEFGSLEDAQGDKAGFDKVVLTMTGDRDRAKNFMKSYYQRVEQANRWFTAFKEGWKTDRGMMYIIFGVPDEVNRKGSSEVWYYRTYRTQFVFNKAGSVFDPEQYTLRRDHNYSQIWYNNVDLWRKSRF